MSFKELENTINALHIDANRLHLEWVTVEHLTLILLQENKTVNKMLQECHADIDRLKRQFSEIVQQQKVNFTSGHKPQLSFEYQRVMQHANRQSKRLYGNKDTALINGIHVVIAILDEPGSLAAHYLKKYGVDRLFALSYLATLGDLSDKTKDSKKDERDWVALAQAKILPVPINRESDVSEIINILCRKFKNNVLLVGDTGVGKTTLIKSLAHRIADNLVPTILQNAKIISISVSDIVAGTKYRGDLEQRIKKIVEKYKGQKNTILFIDEIHTLIGSGTTTGGTLDMASIIKPHLTDTSIRYIGATTTTEYRRYFEKDSALNRRFCKMTVREPDAQVLQMIVDNAVEQLSQHYQLEYPPDATTLAIDAAKRYLISRTFPDKAIDILDYAGSHHILFKNNTTLIDKKLIIAKAKLIAGLNADITLDEYDNLAELENYLCNVVFDQNEAAKKLSRAVILNQIGYHYDEKVVGGFLFVGPTGVGKTEMAKQLAYKLSFPLLRYDMSEYMERHAVSRLIGAPPGYVGFEQSGQLIEDVHNNPSAVILFDEIEKAHPDILNILLQIFDYGVLTDNNGRLINFRNTIIIITSNSGSVEMARGSSGFDRNDKAALGDEIIRRTFAPEFRNRLDGIIHFNSISQSTLEKIIEQQLNLAKQKIKAHQNINIRFSQRLKESLMVDANFADMGARPLKRLIRERIFETIATATVYNKISRGQSITLDIVQDELVLIVQKNKKTVAKKAKVTVDIR